MNVTESCPMMAKEDGTTFAGRIEPECVQPQCVFFRSHVAERYILTLHRRREGIIGVLTDGVVPSLWIDGILGGVEAFAGVERVSAIAGGVG